MTITEEISVSEALEWLTICDEKFIPPKWTSERLDRYAEKLSKHASFIRIEEDGVKKGFVAYYLNDEKREAYISIIAVAKYYRRRGYGKTLMQTLIDTIYNKYESISLEVSKSNVKGLGLYDFYGFKPVEDRGGKYLMRKQL